MLPVRASNAWSPRGPSDTLTRSAGCGQEQDGCGHVSLAERGGYEICRECWFEDDGQDDHDADVVRGGPNGRLSLADARAAYVEKGGNPLPHRPPADPA
jgi:Cysteine-rich CPCC